MTSSDNPKRVLLIEDNPDMLKLLRLTVAAAGCDVLTATNGRDGLTIAAREKPDIVFLDVMMPGLSGFEVCAQLKGDSNTSGCKIIMLTALAQDADRAKAARAGADGYMTKPFSPLELIALLEQ